MPPRAVARQTSAEREVAAYLDEAAGFELIDPEPEVVAVAAPAVKAKAAPARRVQPPPRAVTGPHPWRTSTTGRAYYLVLQPEVVVVAGWGLAWEVNAGAVPAPEGFATIEAALNAADARGHKNVRVRWP